MNFDTYQIPNEYTNKFKVTEKDLKVFQKFGISELVALKEMPNLSKDDISSIHNALMYAFWSIKAKNKEKYTPIKYKKIFI
ncbi:hypothetical protein [uncultured Clostridium sp.]|uniref:hypothetical protein n=1 Tax=uncultured Clostridium sp. TaxID=59620 RepID=UPI0025F1B709|nr:hypothetical protein [uncultured Clostridium sp.]